MNEKQIQTGLLSEGTPVALEGISVEAEVVDFCTRVTITQRYRNQEADPIEAVYVFPLDEGAAVCGFEAIVGGAHIIGRVKERDAAFEEYDDAMERGHGAYLLDQERPDVFTASIGNLPPGAEVLIRISYVAELAREGNDIRFTVPTTVAPRYAPAQDRVGVGRPPAEALNPPVAWDVPYGLVLAVRLELQTPIRAVESPSHPIAVELDGCRGTIRLSAREVALDRDVVLLVRRDDPGEPRALVEVHPNGQRTVLVSFEPHFDGGEVDAAAEIVFLVDRSGSMGGTSIAEARNALQLCLRSLPEGCRFNVVGFGSTFTSLFPETRPLDGETLQAATAHVSALDADLGGTDILPALEAIFGQAPSAGRVRQLVVLTDGEVTNTDAVITAIRRQAERTRVFTFGIGAGPSHHLVRGMARAGAGAAEFIHPGERIEAKVLRQLKKMLAPALSNPQLHWHGLTVKQAPYRLPTLFTGSSVLVYAFVETGVSGEVELTAHGPDGKRVWRIPVGADAMRSGSTIATLAARAMIRDLEEGCSALHERGGSAQIAKREKRITAELVRLGVAYGLASSATSFVAIEERETPVEERAQLRRIPVALTSGWGGLALMGTLTQKLSRSPASVMFEMAAMPRMESVRLSQAGMFNDVLGTRRHRPGQRVLERPLDRLVILQHANGAWKLDRHLAKVLGRTVAHLKQCMPRFEGSREEAEAAWATALALAFLALHAGAERDEWELLAKKAERWLDRCQARPLDGRSWRVAAEDVLGAQPKATAMRE